MYDNHCPFCGGKGFTEGPSGGGSQNIFCSTCKAGFNLMGPLGVQLISEPEMVSQSLPLTHIKSEPHSQTIRLISWHWGKWTFGFWFDAKNNTKFGIDLGPFEIKWVTEDYRP